MFTEQVLESIDAALTSIRVPGFGNISGFLWFLLNTGTPDNLQTKLLGNEDLANILLSLDTCVPKAFALLNCWALARAESLYAGVTRQI